MSTEETKNRFRNVLSHFEEGEILAARRHVDAAREEIRQAERILRGSPLPMFEGIDTIHGHLSQASEILREQ